ncbi:MAG: Bax inhibitor-1/YccA family protein [Sphingobacteriales bacterium]|nr:Bax inhibitor-1/YccA family protein [Sphingobacteriales bacterium]MBI3718057.1 Bax inhibitor-1/YccA family protein [Sphingobacteriales bacterium]
MALFKSGNPTLSEKAFQSAVVTDLQNVMTVRGSLNKFGFLFVMMMASAVFSWKYYYDGANVMPLLLTGAIGGLIVALVITFKKEWSPFLAPAYGLLEGLFVGSISAYYDYAFKEKYPGIIMNAVGITFAVTIAMFLLYNFRIIQATQKFKAIIFTATAGIAIFYLITWVLGMFGIHIPFLVEGSMLGIGFSLFVVAIAALNLILDFDMIEQGAAQGAPKYMEWYAGFGLLVTLVWLYLEILRLLAKLSDRK